MLLHKSDSEIEKDVKEKLVFDPSINDIKIQITVDNGIVTLFGTVGSYFEKTVAERITRSVEGVRGVANEIKVDFLKNFLCKLNSFVNNIHSIIILHSLGCLTINKYEKFVN